MKNNDVEPHEVDFSEKLLGCLVVIIIIIFLGTLVTDLLVLN